MNILPLFPLPIAVCPREFIPLHIFEHRYKVMISDCLQGQGPGRTGEFIVCFSDTHHLSPVGTVVKLLKVLKTYDDGQMDIIATGRSRCAIQEIEGEYDYRTAGVMPHEDDRPDWNEDLATEAYNLHRALIQVVTGNHPSDLLYAGVDHLSFLLASTISLGHGIKQQLISSKNEDERLTLLIGHMSDLMHKVEQVQLAARHIQGYWEIQKIYGTTTGPR